VHGMDIGVGFCFHVLEEFRGSIGEGISHTMIIFASLRAWRFNQNWQSTMRSVCGGLITVSRSRIVAQHDQ
jgi:hypothetical protein